MGLFSQRKGLKPLAKTLQQTSIDKELRNGLWTALYECIYRHWKEYSYCWTPESRAINTLFTRYWIHYFKLPSDTQPSFPGAFEEVRRYFFECPWNEAYDFIEFTTKHCERFSDDFGKTCNMFLERENSAYRIVGSEIAEITDKTELETVELAISQGPKPVRVHLETALSKLSDRKQPDFRNSIKESISAVESVCRLISGDAKATLAPALRKIGEKAKFHPAFEKGLVALYGFTSDEQGIRHSLMDESNVTYSDAKFMLVLCSGFCNFMLGKAAELGLKLK